MIGNPLALLGLLAIAVPVIIHLLGRHRSRIQRFPTLRFLTESRLIPSRRRRISDWPLLVVRAAIVAVAAVALSQPIRRSGEQAIGRSGSGNRAILVDTSASMRRPTTGGGTAIDSARRIAIALQGAAGVSTVIETGDVAASIEGASAWLGSRTGSRELVVISDFQPAALDGAAVARVPKEIGVDLVVLPATGTVATAPSAHRPLIEATAKDRPGVEVAWSAIGERPPWNASASRVTIMYRDVVLSDHSAREDSLIDVPWMGVLLARLQRDPTLQAAARGAKADQPMRWNNVIARNDAGQHIVAAQKTDGSLSILLLDEPASLTSVALLRALIAAMNPPVTGAELDTARTSAATLATWEREATPVTRDTGAPTYARWFWVAALLLLALETWMRSRKHVDSSMAPIGDVSAERAA